jgi:hypothetical protein
VSSGRGFQSVFTMMAVAAVAAVVLAFGLPGRPVPVEHRSATPEPVEADVSLEAL